MDLLRITAIEPAAVLPGGELRLRGAGFMSGPGAAPAPVALPEVSVGGHAAHVVVGNDTLLVVRVPDQSLSGPVTVSWAAPSRRRNGARVGENGKRESNPLDLEVAVVIAENLHPVCNPAIDSAGNIVATYSGARGQKAPVTLFRLDANYTVKPWSGAVTNPSGLAYDRAGTLYVSSRHDGAVYRIAPDGAATMFCEGLGVATGIAFDCDGNLYVGDRSGTIFKVDSERNIFVFATLEPSVAAYHLAFGPDRNLYVTGPSTSSYDMVWRITPRGVSTPFFRGLGRPQGLAFDREGALYAVASYRGRRGVVRIAPDTHSAEVVVAGSGLVGLAFARGPAIILASHGALHHLKWPTPGLALPPEF